MRRTAALIVGGGPAGTAAALTLARGGVRPLLLERDRTQGDPLCGGFLSWRTLDRLERLGVDAGALGAHPISRMRIIAGGRQVEAALPAPSAGLSRRALDGALIELAARAGARVERGVVVREAAIGRVRLETDEIATDALFLATGKHELRGLARPRAAAGDDPSIGLRLRLDAGPGLAKALDGMIELHLFDRGYAGLLMQEDGRANLCLALRRSRLAQAGGDPAALLETLGRESPLLGERIAGGTPAGPLQAVAQVPYGWRATRGAAGLWRLGDQAGVIPSLAGEGIGIALASGVEAAAACLRGEGAARFQRRLAGRTRRPIGAGVMMRDLAERPWATGPLMALAGAAPWMLPPLARLTRIGT